MEHNTAKLLEADARHVWHPFTPAGGLAPLLIQRAQGVWLYPAEGQPILDAISSWWVNLHGHAHPALAQAVAEQARKLEHVIFAGFTHAPAVTLCQRLAELMPGGPNRFFFSDDGSTAVEVALKLLIQYYANRGESRTRLVAFRGGYHGDTFGAMSAGGDSPFHLPFRPFLFHVDYVDPPSEPSAIQTIGQLEALKAQGPLLGLILEALGAVMEWAKVNQVKVIADEVMTGFGRTGKLFAHQHTPIAPDVICLSKGLTGGFLPMGLTGVSEEIAAAFDTPDRAKAFLHGHSYTANPLACAVALASLQLTTHPDTLAAWVRIEQHHRQAARHLAQLPGVSNVRVCGTILALDIDAPDAGYHSQLGPRLYATALAHRVLLRPLGNTLYCIPPYCITDCELEMIYNAMEICVRALAYPV
jgi:adenosylmethionine-8-amino-7-oxononanoate aminotransferase